MLLAGGIVHWFIHEVLSSSFLLEPLYFEHSFKCGTKWAPPYPYGAYILTGETCTTDTQLRTTKNKLFLIFTSGENTASFLIIVFHLTLYIIINFPYYQVF